MIVWNGQTGELFVIFDAMESHLLPDLNTLLAQIVAPDDYFSGVRRTTEPAPDNIIAFVRYAAADLYPAEGMASFHQRWVLLVALFGGGTVEVDREQVTIASGNVLLVPPLHLHGYHTVDKAITWVFFTFDWPQHAVGTLQANSVSHLDALGRNLLTALIAHWNSQARNGDVLAIYLLQFIRHCFPQRKVKEAVSSGLEYNRLIATIHALATERPGIQIPLLAQQIGISESHLRALFRKAVGISLGRYLREHRLRQSVLWFKEENLSVKAAAERAGYPDIYTFSRAFRRLFAVPPSKMRPQ